VNVLTSLPSAFTAPENPKVEKKELPQERLQVEQQEPPPPPIRISALVVSHNRADRLRRAIEALERSRIAKKSRSW